MSWEKPRKNYGFSMGFRGFPADFLWFHHVSPWISARSQHQTPPQITCHRAMVARRRSRTGAVAVLLLAAAVLREAFVVPGGFAIGFDGKFPVFFFICSWDLGKYIYACEMIWSYDIQMILFLNRTLPLKLNVWCFVVTVFWAELEPGSSSRPQILRLWGIVNLWLASLSE